MDEETILLNAQAMKLVYQDRMREGNASWLGFIIRRFEQNRILYGSVFVDSFLKNIGDFIRGELGSCHGFYLRGGCFVILTPSAELTAEAEQHIKERFQKPCVNGERTAFFDISYVTSGGDIRLPSLEEFLLVLEDSLQAAKFPEVGSLVVDKGVLQKIKYKFHVHRLLMAALESNSLEVYLQPMVETGTGRLLGAGALVRLKDSDGTVVFPDEFIPAAESNGLVTVLGLQVFRKVCSFISQGGMQQSGIEWININVSPVQCLGRDLPEKLEKIRKEYGIPIRYIHLEITEQGALGPGGLEQIDLLHRLGYTMILDDFGKGYANSSRVKSIALSGIKIDMSLVWAHFKKPDTYLPNLIKGFRDLGFTITAEGVETEEMVKGLRAMGCNYFQGYYYSRPVPMYEFLKKYRVS